MTGFDYDTLPRKVEARPHNPAMVLSGREVWEARFAVSGEARGWGMTAQEAVIDLLRTARANPSYARHAWRDIADLLAARLRWRLDDTVDEEATAALRVYYAAVAAAQGSGTGADLIEAPDPWEPQS